MSPAITVHNLGKCYRIYSTPRQHLKGLLWPAKAEYKEVWALRNISFSVQPGEVVGIVGRNGSGKSTLLQIIAGTLTPTTGTVSLKGRVAALLELGSGFNPDFSGRENVYLNGLLLGANHAEVTERLGDIENFAELGPYFDQPVRTYSSGMVMRLAFAVQVVLDKDILIVDEALAVGDELFQRKCFAAIERFREAGGTVLFVSHSGETVVQLCDHALLLHRGELQLQGNAKQVMDWYHKLIYAPAEVEERILETMRTDPALESTQASAVVDNDALDSLSMLESSDYDPNLQSCSTLLYEERGATIVNFAILDEKGKKVNILYPRKTYYWTYEVDFSEPAFRVRFGMIIKTPAGLELGGSTFPGLSYVEAGQRIKLRFAFSCLLASGIYFINAGVAGQLHEQEHYLARGIDLGVFRVKEETGRLLGGGPVDFLIKPQLELDVTSP